VEISIKTPFAHQKSFSDQIPLIKTTFNLKKSKRPLLVALQIPPQETCQV